METKKCNKCDLEKPKTEFFKSPRNKDGCRSSCKVCENKANKAREQKYRENGDYRKEYFASNEYKTIKQLYYEKNTEKVLKSNAAWRQTFKGRLLSYKRAAKKRNIDWLLTDEEFNSFWQKPCSYCGDEIETIGIDRLNSDEGYYLENCVSCCSTCNKMKMDLNKELFIDKIKQIIKNLKLD
jgi:hypothetical protein